MERFFYGQKLSSHAPARDLINACRIIITKTNNMATLLHQLIGTWFIIATNFPMWLKGDKLSPEFNYTLTERKGEQVLFDEVKYIKKRKPRSIKGYDHPDTKKENGFTWRGKGLLAIAKSNWEVRLIDEKAGWAVIYFSKTIFTPEGVDIISRDKTMDKIILQDIKNKMMNDPVLKQHVESLVVLKDLK